MNTLALKRIILLRGFCHPAIGAAISTLFKGKVPSRGFTIDTQNRHISASNIASIFWGLYERPEIRFVRRYLRRDLDIIELGSSLGIVSLNIIKVQARERKLTCVEANPYLIETIKRNIELNAAWKMVEVLNRAVDYNNRAEVSFSIDSGNLGSHIGGNVGGAETVSVKTTTLRELVEGREMHEFALVCDIEGAEAGMLAKDAAILERCRQLIIELHETEYEGRSLSVADLRDQIETQHNFKLVAQHQGVHVFLKD